MAELLEQYYLPPSDPGFITEERARALIIAELQDYRGQIIVGAGSQVFRASNQGIQLGSGTFSTAPFSVDMEGNVFAQQLTATSFVDLGDGSDGAVTISADTTLTSNMEYTNLTIDSTKVLTTAGYSIRCTGTLTINGTIRNNGGAGGVATGGTAAPAGSLAGGAAGAAGISSAGSSNGNAGTGVTSSQSGAGGAGGNSSANTGGAGGAATAAVNTVTQAGPLLNTGATVASFTGGGGGGGGALTNGGGGNQVSGSGGGGGGVIDIACATLVNNGAIQAHGGAGSAGSWNGFGGSSVGGGAGGGGGFIRLVYRTSSGSGTVTATGGTGGAGGGTGGLTGANGSNGNVFTFDLA